MDNTDIVKKYKKIIKIINNDKLLPTTKYHLISLIFNPN